MADRMDVVCPRSYTTRDGEVKTAFSKIGVAFQTKNGWAIQFEALPLPQLEDGKLVTKALLMPPREQTDAPRSSGRGNAPPADFSDLRDDKIPFTAEWRG
jgi:hypothetical protein